MDAYFIQSNADTQAHDLIDGLDELCRTKMVHPIFFHLQFPIVAHLVSYFTSANYRRLVRHGREDVQTILRHVAVPNHPEYDYPCLATTRATRGLRPPWRLASSRMKSGTPEASREASGGLEESRETLPDSEERKQEAPRSSSSMTAADDGASSC